MGQAPQVGRVLHLVLRLHNSGTVIIHSVDDTVILLTFIYPFYRNEFCQIKYYPQNPENIFLAYSAYRDKLETSVNEDNRAFQVISFIPFLHRYNAVMKGIYLSIDVKIV